MPECNHLHVERRASKKEGLVRSHSVRSMEVSVTTRSERDPIPADNGVETGPLSTGPAVVFEHKNCGGHIEQLLRCKTCGRLPDVVGRAANASSASRPRKLGRLFHGKVFVQV